MSSVVVPKNKDNMEYLRAEILVVLLRWVVRYLKFQKDVQLII